MNNLQVTPFPGNLTRDIFIYDPEDHHLFVNSTPVLSLEWEQNQLTLGQFPATFQVDENGLVWYEEDEAGRPQKRDDNSDDWYVAPRRSYDRRRMLKGRDGSCSEEEIQYMVFVFSING